MPVPTHEAVASAIRAEMARQRKPQRELAELLGISQVAVSRRMLGQTALDINELVAIADYLGVPVTVLLPEGAAA